MSQYKRMFSHLNNRNILAKEKFGFGKNSSTALATRNLLGNIYMALNNKCIVGGIICDLSKAFDHISHNILLSKMKSYGIKAITKKLNEILFEGKIPKGILTQKRK
jgi:hypothetical protein